MLDAPLGSDRHAELVDVIHRVRNRWRMKLALRGAVIVLAGTLLALLLSASSLEALRFSPTAIITFRVVALVVFTGLVFIGFVRPLRRRVSDSQVALYLEERDRTLETAILSAIDSSSAATRAADPNHRPSPHLVDKLVEQAIEKVRAIDNGLAVERAGLRRQLMALGVVAAAAGLLITFGPAFLRSGLSALLIVYRSAEAASPYKIDVLPGNVKIPRGADQSIAAKLQGFASSEATLMVRVDAGGQFQRVPMVPAADPASFEGTLFQVEKTAEYFVVSKGVESPRFTMEVLDLPTVDKLVLEYSFPGYTGLPPRTVDPGGDIAAIAGTQVRVKITPTMATPGGRVLLNENESLPLTKEPDGTLATNFTVSAQGFYKFELDGPNQEKISASPQYTIDVLSDIAPAVHFSKPGRDTTASPVEEVFAEVRADDDFGVKQLQMFYSVNGGEEKTINLFGGARTLPEVSATHTLYLEEMGLTPGDFVSYYAKAADNDGVAGSKTTTSDIYFVQIKPFRKDYKPAQSMAGGGGAGGGGGAEQVGQLSQQQREIVAATFNTVRDKPKMTAEKFRENTVFLTLAQAKLRQQVEELSGKMNSRLDAVDPAFKVIAEALPKAAEAMKAAEGNLRSQQAKEALSPEQKALKLLQDAEQQYEMQVSSQRGGGGGGAGANQMAEDLADLFELELDKLANQYEMQQRAEQQGGDKQVDELMEKLKELARRQQQEADRQRRLAAANQNQSGGGSGDAQRQLAQELEDAARKLEQLTRDQQRPELRDAARDLREAANAMRQAAANGARDGGAQAQAALDKLKEVQRKLQNNQGGRGERDVENAMRQADELASEQKEIAEEVAGLDAMQGQQRQSKAQSLSQRKDAMDQKVAGLQDDLEKMANGARRDAKEAARKLDEAAGSITDKRVREKIRYTKGTLQGQASEYARAMEADIQANLEALRNKIGDAQKAFGQADKQDALGRAQDKMRDLVRGMESLGQRMGDRAAQNKSKGTKGSEDSKGSKGSEDAKSSKGSESSKSSDGSEGADGSESSTGSEGSKGSESSYGQRASAQDGSQQGGDRSANGANSGGPWGGSWNGSDWGGWWAGGYYNPDDVRQFRREFREWAADAEQLRRLLAQQGIEVKDLDQALRDLRSLDADKAFVDGASLAALQAAALNKLKMVEFNLRKKAEGKGNEQLSLSGSDEVPAGFRTAIEEYYRALAKK